MYTTIPPLSLPIHHFPTRQSFDIAVRQPSQHLTFSPSSLLSFIESPLTLLTQSWHRELLQTKVLWHIRAVIAMKNAAFWLFIHRSCLIFITKDRLHACTVQAYFNKEVLGERNQQSSCVDYSTIIVNITSPGFYTQNVVWFGPLKDKSPAVRWRCGVALLSYSFSFLSLHAGQDHGNNSCSLCLSRLGEKMLLTCLEWKEMEGEQGLKIEEGTVEGEMDDCEVKAWGIKERVRDGERLVKTWPRRGLANCF